MFKNLENLCVIVLVLFLLVAIGCIFIFRQSSSKSFGKAITADWNRSLEEPSRLPDEVLKEKDKVSIVFVGDMMFDRYIRQIAEVRGYDFILIEIKDYLKSADYVVANLEGPITKNPSVSKYSEFGSRNNYIFTFEPIVLDTLIKDNISILNVGNNHILNFGLEGLEQTITYLNEYGVRFFGQVGNESVVDHLVIEKNNLKITMVNYNQFIGEQKHNTIDAIGKLKTSSDFLVVYTHWGNEYASVAGRAITDLAHEFIDAGADLVVGSHPHVIQQTERYKNKMIYYSLGNFVFDQYFSKETMEGLVLKLDLERMADDTIKVDDEKIFIQMSLGGQTTLSIKP